VFLEIVPSGSIIFSPIINISHPFSIIQRFDLFVDVATLRRPPSSGVWPRGENSHENDVCVRTFFLVFRDQAFDAFGNFIGAVPSAVVRADHQDDDFWINSVNLSFVRRQSTFSTRSPSMPKSAAMPRIVATKFLSRLFPTGS